MNHVTHTNIASSFDAEAMRARIFWILLLLFFYSSFILSSFFFYSSFIMRVRGNAGASCHTYHVTRMNESCHTDKQVMSYIQI